MKKEIVYEKTLFKYDGELNVESAIVSDWDGNSIAINFASIPNSYVLSPAFPNPFNPTTTLNFTLEVHDKVSMDVYNMQGQKVASLIDHEMGAGSHSVNWNADAFSSGIYFVKMLTNGGFESTQKITLIK